MTREQLTALIISDGVDPDEASLMALKILAGLCPLCAARLTLKESGQWMCKRCNLNTE